MKGSKIIISIFIIIGILFAYNNIYASEILNLIPDAGTTGIAGLSDNSDNSIWSVYNNQANIASFDMHLFSFSYKRLMNLFNFINLAGGFKLKYGYAGIGISYMDYGSETLITGIDASTGLPVGGEDFYSYDLLVATAYGYDFSSIGLSAGIGIKLLQNSIANRDLLYAVFDVSFIEMVGDIKLNLNVRNVDIGLSSIQDLPVNLNFNVLIPSTLFIKQSYNNQSFYIVSGVNFDMSDSVVEKVYGSLGADFMLNNRVNLRTGVFLGKNNVFIQFNSLGIGYQVNNAVKIDYSFSRESEYTEFTHSFTVQYALNPGTKKHKKSKKKKSKKVKKSSAKNWDVEDLEDE